MRLYGRGSAEMGLLEFKQLIVSDGYVNSWAITLN